MIRGFMFMPASLSFALVQDDLFNLKRPQTSMGFKKLPYPLL
jgi:hypothetical protein